MQRGGGRLPFACLLGFVGLAATVVAMAAGITDAFAAGSGYGPPGPPTAAAGAGFSTVVTAQDVGASGGSVSGSAFGATAIVVVPPGSLPNGGEIVLTAGDPTTINVGGSTVIADFGVDVLDPNTGSPEPGPFNPPLTITIDDGAITPTDLLVTVPLSGQSNPVAGSVVKQGEATASFSSDPNFAVVAPAPVTAAASSPTTTHTGEPFLGEELASAIAGPTGFGLLLARGRRSRSRRASRRGPHLARSPQRRTYWRP